MKHEGKRHGGGIHWAMSAVGAIVCVILCLLLICNLTIIIKGTLYPERPPSIIGITPMVVRSGSMSGDREGHIEVGDLIFVGKAEPQELRVGDVIAYMMDRIVITHRVVDIQTDESGALLFTTRGDANNTVDAGQISEESIVGIYINRIPKVGDFALFLQTPLGMVIFIGIPVLGFIIYDIIRRQYYANKERKQNAEMAAELERLRILAGENPKTEDTYDQTTKLGK